MSLSSEYVGKQRKMVVLKGNPVCYVTSGYFLRMWIHWLLNTWYVIDL